jgi:hypothetical protein
MTQGKWATVNSTCRVFQPESTPSQFVFPEFALLRAHDRPGRPFNAVLADCDLLPRPGCWKPISGKPNSGAQAMH